MRLVLIHILLIAVVLANGQSASTQFGNSHKIRINSNGALGINLDNLSPSSFDSKTANNPYFAQAGLWVVAKNKNGLYHTATQYIFAKDSFDFWPGPIDTLTGETGNTEDWEQVWTVSQKEIDNHKLHYHETNYDIHDNIKKWPAMGFGGFAKYLAPFVDVNKNKIYDPKNGDYPAINGTNATYCIFNDLAEEHSASLGQELGIEVQLLATTYDNSDLIFLEYYVINRGSTDYSDINIGFFIDGECGNRNDNFAATYPTFPQSTVVYNGDNKDEGFFETDLPFVQAIFLNENLEKSIAFDRGKGLSGRPVTNNDYIHLGLGKWKNGSSLTFGGNGQSGTVEAKHIFAHYYDNSNPNSWSELDSQNSPGERTILGITTEKKLQTNGFIRRNIALQVGTFSSTQNLSQKVYENGIAATELYRKTSRTPAFSQKPTFQVFPNPSNGQFWIQQNKRNFQIEIFNNQGVTVYTARNNSILTNECNITVPPGVYYIRITNTTGTAVQKICITP